MYNRLGGRDACKGNPESACGYSASIDNVHQSHCMSSLPRALTVQDRARQPILLQLVLAAQL